MDLSKAEMTLHFRGQLHELNTFGCILRELINSDLILSVDRWGHGSWHQES